MPEKSKYEPVFLPVEEQEPEDKFCPMCAMELSRSGHCPRCGYCEKC